LNSAITIFECSGEQETNRNVNKAANKKEILKDIIISYIIITNLTLNFINRGLENQGNLRLIIKLF
jgi:hypothetical protein